MGGNGEHARGVETLAEALLGDVERIAEHAVTRAQELLPAHARVPRDKIMPVARVNTRELLEAVRDPDADRPPAEAHFRVACLPARDSGELRASLGIPTDEMLSAWRICLEVVREQARLTAEELGIGNEQLLEFVVATFQWGDVATRASASAYHEVEIREIGRLMQEQAALRRVATLVAQDVASDELFGAVAREVGMLFDADYTVMIRYAPDHTDVTTLATWAAAGEYPAFRARSPLGPGDPPVTVAETGKPMRVDDWTGIPGPVAEYIGRELGVKSSVLSPIVVGGSLWGALGLHSKSAPLPLDTESRLLSFSELVATAIANVKARDEVRGLADEQASLRRVATLVAEGVGAEELFAAVAHEVAGVIGVRMAALNRYESDRTFTTLGIAGDTSLITVGSRWPVEEEGVAGRILASRGPVRKEDYTEMPGPVGKAMREEQVSSAVGVPIVVEGNVWGFAAAFGKPDSPIPAGTEKRLASFTELVATAIANSQANERLAELADEQAALRRVATMVARESSAEEIFAAVAEGVGRLVGVELVMISRYEPEGDSVIVADWGREALAPSLESGLKEAVRVGARLKLDGESISASVYRTGRPARCEYADPSGSIGAFGQALGVRAGLGIPIVVNGRLWGAIIAATTQPAPIASDAGTRMAKFTELVATAIANTASRAELAASRARIVAAADDARRRIERDLHDGAQQRLVTLMAELRKVEASMPIASNEQRAEVGRVAASLGTAVEELRELSRGIHPVVLTRGGLPPALKALKRRSAVRVSLDVRLADRLPEQVEAAAYYAVSEALTNASRHASATRVWVSAEVASDTLRLSIRDDGVGGADANRGSGLTGLSDRIEAAGGTVQVKSPRGGGTTIEVQIPVS